MRAADDFATIRARMQELALGRAWLTHDRDGAARDAQPERTAPRAVQQIKDEMKARIISRNRLG